jgi:DNA-binding SARP family transcriptional activator
MTHRQAVGIGGLVRFKILGSLVLESDTGPVDVAGQKRRALLLRLLVSANHPVSDDRLVEDLWEGTPSVGAVSTLASHISFLRQAVGRERIARRSGGYALVVDDWAVDAACFEREGDAGRRALAAGDASAAIRLFTRALERWNGPALLDVGHMAWARNEVARLEELRLMSYEGLLDSRLGVGEHQQLIAMSEDLVSDYPFRERLWGQLMIALYRSGRQADALRAYQRLRTMLRDELGLEPTTAMASLESAILRQDPDLDWLGQSAIDFATGNDGSPGAEGSRPGPMVLPRRLDVRPDVGLVGRDAHVQSMMSAIKRVAADEGHEIILISGEAGQGKTALVAEVAQRANDDGACVLFGHCEEGLAGPYQLFAEALSHFVSHASEDQLVSYVERYGSELARLVPGLADRIPDLPPTRITDADTQRSMLFSAVVGLFVVMSRHRHVVVVLEDLQWADQGSLLLLRHVASAGESMQILVLGTYRDSELSLAPPLVEALGALWRERGTSQIELTGLDRTGVVSFMECTVGQQLDDAGLRIADAIHEQTDGNPFFVNELLRHLAQTEAHLTESWVAGDIRLPTTLPRSIRDVISARLVRMGPEVQRVLPVAAVIGRDFDVGLLSHAARMPMEALLVVLEHAATAALVDEAPDSSGTYSFTHALIQHTLYEELGPNRRAQAHLTVAESLEVLGGGRPRYRVGELARHWLLAPQPKNRAKAIAYSRLAGDVAMADLAPADAVDYYARALDLLGQTDGDDPGLELDLAIGLGSAQLQSGRTGFRETLLDAGRRADALGDSKRLIAVALAATWSNLGVYDSALVEIFETAIQRIPRDDVDRAVLLGQLCKELTYGTSLQRRRDLADEAFSIAQASDDDATIVRVFVDVMQAILVPAFVDEMFARSRQVHSRAEQSGDPALLFWAADRGRIAAGYAGVIDEIDRCLAIERSLVGQLGNSKVNWAYHRGRAWRALIAGDHVEAEQFATQSFEYGSATRESVAAGFFAAQLVDVHRQRGTLAELTSSMERTVDRSPGMPVVVAWLATAFAYGGNLDGAHNLLHEFASSGFDLPMDPVWMSGMASWADVAIECADPIFAGPLFERLQPWAHQFSANGVTAEGPVCYFLGGLCSLLEHYDDAETYFAASAAFSERHHAKFFAARTNLLWGQMLVARGTPGDAEKARSLLGQARSSAADHGFGLVQRRAEADLRCLA